MNKYYVQIPITGYISMEVDAENEDSAIDIAYKNASIDDIDEWNLQIEDKSVLLSNINIEKID